MDHQNPYASPREEALAAAGGGLPGDAWRSGALLVVRPNAVLPDRCVKCNAPAEGYKRRLKLAWHSPLAFLGLLGGLLPYIIIALILTNRLTVHVGMCPAHVRKRRLSVAFTAMVAVAGFGLLFAAVLAENGVFALLGLAALLAALVCGAIGTRIVWPKKIEKQVAWISGVSPAFLAEMPEFAELVRPLHP